MKRIFWAVLLSMLYLISGYTGQPSAEPPQNLTVLTIGTADSGGTMYPVGAAIADVLSSDQLKINVSASTGSAMNVQSLITGEVDLALVSGDVAYESGRSPEGKSLRAVAAVYISQSNWLAPESSGAVYVHDLGGMRVGVGPQDSSSELTARIALEAAGLSEGAEIQNCSLGAGGELVLSGKLDVIHGFTGAPINGLFEVADQLPCRILRYTEDELDLILSHNEFYLPVTLPAGTYTGQRQDIQTFGVKCLLCVNDSMDEDTAYHLAKAIWENREDLGQAHPAMESISDLDFLYKDISIPLHQGADKFYNEIQQD